MTKRKSLVRHTRPLLIVLSIIVLAFGLWSGSSAHRRERSIQELRQAARTLSIGNLKKQNSTRSFYLDHLEKTKDGDLQLSLRNGYEKSITGFQVSIGGVQTQVEFMYNEEQMIRPGGIHVEVLPVQPETQEMGISVLCVVFEDGTSDGDERFIRQITEKRSGERIQIKRVLALMTDVFDGPETRMVAALDGLESRVASLPEDRGDGLRGDFELGLHDAKLRMLDAIRDRRNSEHKHRGVESAGATTDGPTNYKEHLSKLVERYQKIVSQP